MTDGLLTCAGAAAAAAASDCASITHRLYHRPSRGWLTVDAHEQLALEEVVLKVVALGRGHVLVLRLIDMVGGWKEGSERFFALHGERRSPACRSVVRCLADMAACVPAEVHALAVRGTGAAPCTAAAISTIKAAVTQCSSSGGGSSTVVARGRAHTRADARARAASARQHRAAAHLHHPVLRKLGTDQAFPWVAPAQRAAGSCANRRRNKNTAAACTPSCDTTFGPSPLSRPHSPPCECGCPSAGS